MTRFSMQSHTRRKTGFTLIELLVVIAIIALLAAILFPVFARARENARRSSCQSNLKQIGLGIMQYTQDFDERMPQQGGLEQVAGGRTYSPSWRVKVYPYVKSTQIFQCPSNPRARTQIAEDTTGRQYETTEAGWNPISGQPKMMISYAMNIRFGGPKATGTNGNHPGMLLPFVETPAQKLMVTESTRNNVGEATIGDYYGSINDEFSSTTAGLFSGHLSTVNVLFGDGHVKALKPTATMTPLNMWGRFSDNTASQGTGCDYNTYDASTANDVENNINCDGISNAALGFLRTNEVNYR